MNIRRKIVAIIAGLLAAFIVMQVTGLDDELDLDLAQTFSGMSDAVSDGLEFATDGTSDPGTGGGQQPVADADVDVQAVAADLDALTVKGRAPTTGYDRDQFDHWTDPDGNGCDTRNDMLARDLEGEDVDSDGCTVLSGTIAYEPYTGQTGRYFERANSDLDVSLDAEHVVALQNAWVSGAHAWDDDKREQIANDPANVIMVDPSQNRAKGAKNAAEWLPPNKAFRCEYIAIQVQIKTTYDLAVTQPEHDAMARVLEAC